MTTVKARQRARRQPSSTTQAGAWRERWHSTPLESLNDVDNTFDAFHDAIGGRAIWDSLERSFIPRTRRPLPPTRPQAASVHTPEQPHGPHPSPDDNYCVPVRSIVHLVGKQEFDATKVSRDCMHNKVIPLAQTRPIVAPETCLRPTSTLWKAERN
ncbi:hypothetical protein K523DRAFT_356800 [Schizophyllum commune Tattone D]|nr:hypothetical protein K523DRAFT_356800 [Schizophyllum commune Tattone D]